MRTPDVISLEMMDEDYWIYRESLQFMDCKHTVTLDGLQRRICDQRKNLAELEQTLARMKEQAA